MIYPSIQFHRQVIHVVQKLEDRNAFDPTFLAVRKEAEDRARAILNGVGSVITEAEYLKFLEEMNLEHVVGSGQAKPGLTRFRRSYASAKVTQSRTQNNFQRVRSWLPDFWRRQLPSDDDVAYEFDRVNVAFIRPFVFSLMLYLRSPLPVGNGKGDPEGERKYFVWAKPLEEQMAKLLGRDPRSVEKGQNYLLFNHECRQLQAHFRLEPQAVDFLLYSA